MTERRIARSEFRLTRDYAAPIDRVWRAFADEQDKLGWWGAGDRMDALEWVFDFRVGGVDVAEGRFHGGVVSRYVATYTDIVENNRIVTTYDMWINGAHMSTSVASLEFETIPSGTRYTHAEHGVFFDQFWADGPNRESGTHGLIEQLARYLEQPA
jgi:uncharacterized protein YndB with AHSA1/START domain